MQKQNSSAFVIWFAETLIKEIMLILTSWEDSKAEKGGPGKP